MCHRFRGLARVDKEGDYRLFYVDESFFSRGSHARVSCTGCHADIEKIPHDDAKPVDCLRSCHIEEPTREIIFTHAKVRKSLEDSVHSPMARSGAAQGNPEDYPRCKDCHDIPLFRPISIFKKMRAGVSEQAINRCTQCHADENFVRYFYSHVTLILVNVGRSLKRKGQRGLRAWISAVLALPMIPKRRDLSDLVVWAKYVFFLSPQRPSYGHFSWKEKLEYLGLFWGIPLLGVTGILL